MTSIPHAVRARVKMPQSPSHDPKGSRGALLLPLAGGAAALAVAMGIGRFAYTPILPAMQRAAHLAIGQAGLLASTNYAGYLAGALLTAMPVRGAARGRLRGMPRRRSY